MPSEVVTGVLLGRVERGSVVYIDGFRGYGRVSALGYGHLSVRRSSGVYTVEHVHVNGAESSSSLASPRWERLRLPALCVTSC